MGHNAAVYVRISEDREGAELGVERQERDCRVLAEQLGWSVIDPVFKDNDISAYFGKPRPGYRAMLAALQGGEADAVIAWHTDRLHRRDGEGYQELQRFIDLSQERGIPTHTVKAGILDLSTASGRMTARIHAAVALHESEQKSERIIAQRIQATSAGRWTGNKRPYGFEKDSVTVRQDEAQALSWAASQLLAGRSLRSLAQELNRRGDLSSTGAPWDARTLGRVLKRPRNAGLSVYRGEVVGQAQWPAILPEDLWRGVCAVLGDPSRRDNPGRPPTWLGSNLYRCGICGEVMISKARGGRWKMTVYTCSASAHLSRNAKEVDGFIEAVVIERMSRPDAADLLGPDRKQDVSQLLVQDEALRARLDEQARLHADGLIDGRQLAEGTASIRHQREEVTAALAAASRGSVLAGVADAEDPAAAWAGLDLSRKRAIIEVLMTVTVLRARRGRRSGWERGESYFDPDSIAIAWKR
jgi:site-specific DNA recombinase